MISKTVKFIETESRMVVSRDWGKAVMDSCCLFSIEFQFCKMKTMRIHCPTRNIYIYICIYIYIYIHIERERERERALILKLFLKKIKLQKGMLLLFFLGPHLQHMEVPRLGVKSEPQLLTYTTATETPDPSCVCDLHHSS